MNIEEAIEKLELMEYKYTLTNNDDKAIETVLNELDKDRNRIDELINEATIKDAEIERLKEYEYMYKDLCN